MCRKEEEIEEEEKEEEEEEKEGGGVFPLLCAERRRRRRRKRRRKTCIEFEWSLFCIEEEEGVSDKSHPPTHPPTHPNDCACQLARALGKKDIREREEKGEEREKGGSL